MAPDPLACYMFRILVPDDIAELLPSGHLKSLRLARLRSSELPLHPPPFARIRCLAGPSSQPAMAYHRAQMNDCNSLNYVFPLYPQASDEMEAFT
jgi:hypothetical protein